MAKKTITVTEDAYEGLLAHKRRDESASDVIKRLTSAKTNPLDSAGTCPGFGAAVDATREGLDREVEGRERYWSR